MTEIIEFKTAKSQIELDELLSEFVFTEEQTREIKAETSALVAKVLGRLNALDHSFSIEATAEAGAVIQKSIYAMRTDYSEIIVDLTQDLIRAKIEVFSLRNGCHLT